MPAAAFQFPGQGSQAVGMGADLAADLAIAREVFEEADDRLGFSLSRLCWEGPQERLTETENAQPALLTHSVAVWRCLDAEGIDPVATAGHSLGEFSAHVAAGSLTFGDAVALVRLRGEAMAEAGRAQAGTMAAIIGLDDDRIAELCEGSRGDGVLTAANYNAPGQVVISGSADAVERAIERAAEFGARKAIPLNVSGAFHSPLMSPARERLEQALGEITISRPRVPVVTNVDAEAVTEPDAIRSRLIDQLTAPVRWTDCVKRLSRLDVDLFLELGTGTVLTGLLRRIDRSATGRAVGTREQIEEEVSQWR